MSGIGNSLEDIPLNIVRLIKYFIDTRRYSLVDRMSLALSPESVEIALYDMLRLIDSLYPHSIEVGIKSGDKEYRLSCCEYGENLGYGIYGEIVTVYKGPEELKGRKIYCAPCPKRPSMNEVKEFLRKIKNDITIARKACLLAFGYIGGE